MAKTNCTFCRHYRDNRSAAECERFQRRSEDCLTWLELSTRELMRETHDLLQGYNALNRRVLSPLDGVKSLEKMG